MRLVKTFKNTLAALALAIVGMVSVGNSSAYAVEDFVFGYTFEGYSRQLILNGGATIIEATNSGWYNSTGGTNFPTDSNYIVGQSPAGTFRNFFTFNLSGVTEPITSAVLSIYNPGIGFTGGDKTFVARDATLLYTSLLSGIESAATYNAIGAGTVIGSTLVTSASNDTNVQITLNPYAIAVLNALEGSRNFAIGGTIGLSAVPLPAALPMFGFAVAGLFGAARRKKHALAA